MASRYQVISPITLTLLLVLLQAATPAWAVEWIRIGGAGATLAPIRLVAKQFTVQHPDVVFEIMTGLGSRGGVRAVLAGALVVCVADILVRLLPPERELKLGVLTALAGAPFFIWLVWKERRRWI